MKLAASLSILAFILVSWTLGLKLLALHRTTRQAPELWMGASLIFIGGLAYPFAFLASLPAVLTSGWGRVAFTACSWSAHGGVMSTFFFVYLVFRRDSGVARLATWAVSALMLTSAGVQAYLAFSDRTLEEFLAANALPAAAMLTIAVCTYTWSAVESFRYWTLMRRRAALGLSDPVATNRFLLWGIAGTTMVIGGATNLVASIATPLSVLHPVALLITAICGFTNSTAFVLTFVPPAWYTSWVRGQATAS